MPTFRPRFSLYLGISHVRATMNSTGIMPCMSFISRSNDAHTMLYHPSSIHITIKRCACNALPSIEYSPLPFHRLISPIKNMSTWNAKNEFRNMLPVHSPPRLPRQGVLALRALSFVVADSSLPPIGTQRLFDAVNILLSYQNRDGGWATYENTRGFRW